MEPPIAAGTILQNRYHLIRVLGQGGFGRTYLAEDQGRFNERCALKELIPPQTGAFELNKSKELFQREAETLYKINHPQIPQFRENFEQDGRLFLVQDYVEGKTYRELLNDRKAQTVIQSTDPNAPGPALQGNAVTDNRTFSEAEVRQMLLHLLPVLDHIHSKNIIHRDITPDNIILRKSDALPVLIDFGVVKELATRFMAPAGTAPLTTVGKVGYAPSEQLQTGRAYASSDLYSLAATAVVLLTGKEPQSLFDDNALTWNWRRWAMNVTDDFANVLNRMLAYRPGDRYQSAMEVMQALQPGAATPQPIAPPPPPPPPPQPQQPPVSNVATVAVGRRPEPESASHRNPGRPDPVVPEPNERSLWDNPWAVVGIGTGLALLAGLGSWAIFSSLRNAQDPGVTESPPIVTETPVPTVTDTETPTPTPTETTPYSRRLDLASGQTITESGSLTAANPTVNYLVRGQQDQRLSATIPVEGVLMSVLGPDGRPVGNRARRVQQWEGTLPFTGDYTIQLSPVQGLSEADYRLVVSLAAPTVPASPSPTVPASPSPTVPTSPSPTTSPTPTPQYDEERVNIQAGTPSLELLGQTGPQRVKRYLIRVPEGQALTVNVQEGGVNVNVRFPNGHVERNASGLQFVTPGEYAIDVISPERTNFVLQATLGK
ncbi:MAG: serine/threonine protein kinase [Coleofasciculus sp. S288]|nr:serine/threonine protein kinase [Coleofasciculus sp. S288]